MQRHIDEAMSKYTLEPVGFDGDSKAPLIYRLYVDGEPTVIAISAEEAARLRQNPRAITRSALEAIFKCSPTRKERFERTRTQGLSRQHVVSNPGDPPAEPGRGK